MNQKRPRGWISKNPEKKPHFDFSNSSDSFLSANDLSDDFAELSFEKMSVPQPVDPMDQTIGTNADIVSLICVELVEVNGEDLKSPMLNAYDALILFRQVFKIPDENLFGIAIIKGANRGIGFNFPLKQPVTIHLSQYQEFEFKLNDDIYKGKLYQPVGPPPKLGDDVIVTVKKTGFNITKQQILDWLKLFGAVCGEIDYRTIDGLPALKEDTLEVLMRLNKHIPSILPAYGRKLYTQYRGQPILCSSCYSQGHMRKSCTGTRLNWIEYVKSLYDSGLYAPVLFGTWRNSL